MNNVRTDASYIYEEFIRTEGTDVKVYSLLCCGRNRSILWERVTSMERQERVLLWMERSNGMKQERKHAFDDHSYDLDSLSHSLECMRKDNM